ncbi:MAG: type II toxin-antitoxin system VapC family toxin [Acidobacteriota bacterium]
MTLYLDTSSLVKLYVAEPGTDDVRRLVDDAAVVATSLIAYVEMRAALARRRREKALTARDYSTVRRAFDQDWPAYVAIEVSAPLCREAGDLAERYRLRGYDSIHLAAYAEVVRRAGSAHTRFSSFDRGLTRAARALARSLARG